MKILHLTDFHFNEDSKSMVEQNLITEAIVDKLNTENSDIDLVLFSGDLVQNGNSRSILDTAKKTLLDKIVENTSIPNNMVFICSGNHESHQNQELPAIKTEIDKIKDVKTLDLFISHIGQFEASLANFKNYIEFKNDFYLEHKIFEENQDVIKDLYSVHKRKIDNIEIGIVTINSAWRSYDSLKDKGQLLYPISLLKEAASLVKDCKIKIFVLHHCLSDFKEFIQSEMEDIIYSDFHLLFSGHYHKHKASTHINGDEGIFCDVSPASLSLNNKHTTIGFTVVDVDVETFEVEVCIYNYNSLNNSFFLFDSIKSEIPFNHIKREQNELRKTIRKRYKDSIEEANCIFLSTNESTSDKTFLNLFTNPILKTKI
jgi:DNA repair exonuclease SbcCD nuclease subunit